MSARFHRGTRRSEEGDLFDGDESPINKTDVRPSERWFAPFDAGRRSVVRIGFVSGGGMAGNADVIIKECKGFSYARTLDTVSSFSA
jgi:hypothetical protein